MDWRCKKLFLLLPGFCVYEARLEPLQLEAERKTDLFCKILGKKERCYKICLFDSRVFTLLLVRLSLSVRDIRSGLKSGFALEHKLKKERLLYNAIV